MTPFCQNQMQTKKLMPLNGGCCQKLAKVPWQRYSFMVSLTHAKRSSRLKSWSCNQFWNPFSWNFSPLRHPVLRELIPRIGNPAICLTAGMASCIFVNSNVNSNVRKWSECQSSLKCSPASKQLDPGSTLDSTLQHLWVSESMPFKPSNPLYLWRRSSNLGLLPVRWARSHTASAEDALIHPIQLGPILASMSMHTITPVCLSYCTQIQKVSKSSLQQKGLTRWYWWLQYMIVSCIYALTCSQICEFSSIESTPPDSGSTPARQRIQDTTNAGSDTTVVATLWGRHLRFHTHFGWGLKPRKKKTLHQELAQRLAVASWWYPISPWIYCVLSVWIQRIFTIP